MIAKMHIVNEKKLVAVCDDELLGKKFEENELQIDLTGNFYTGEKIEEDKLEEMLKNAYVADFVGEKSVKFGIKKKLISEGSIVKIKGIPHAQVFTLS